MKIYLASLYLEPGIHFDISYNLWSYITNQLNHYLLEDLKLEDKLKHYDFGLNITTTAEADSVMIEGPFVDKEMKSLKWDVVLPYEKVVSSVDPRAIFVKYLFDAIVELLPKYKVEATAIRSVQQVVEAEVIGNSAYDMEEEEAFLSSQFDISELELEPDLITGQASFPLIIHSTTEVLYFWVMWHDDEDLMTHGGKVGENGEFQQIPLNEVANLEKELLQRYEEKLSQGYREVEPGERTELVIYYENEEKEEEMIEALKKSDHLERLLNEWLGATGNGYCLEGEVEEGRIDMFCSVLDVEKGCATVLEALEAEGLLGGVKIAYWDDKQDGHQLLYPVEKKGMPSL